MSPKDKGMVAWLATWSALTWPATFLLPGWWFLIPLVPTFFAAQAMEAAVVRYYQHRERKGVR